MSIKMFNIVALSDDAVVISGAGKGSKSTGKKGNKNKKQKKNAKRKKVNIKRKKAKKAPKSRLPRLANTLGKSLTAIKCSGVFAFIGLSVLVSATICVRRLSGKR
jgi:hypothetical protein